MTIKYVENLVSERNALATQVMALADLASKENRSLSESENTSIASMRQKIDTLDAEVRSWNATSEAFGKFQQISRAGTEKRALEKAENTRPRTAGEAFVESDAFERRTAVGATDRVQVPMLETRATILTSTDLGQGEWPPVQVPGYGPPNPPLTFWNLVPKVNVSDGSITYPVYNAGSEAAVVAEGEAKPEMTWSMSLVTETVPTIAHWVKYSRQFASDKNYIRQVIDGELRRGVERKLNSEAVTAINGVATTPVTGPTLLEAIRLGIAKVETYEEGDPDVLLIHPNDRAAIDIELMSGTLGGAAYGQPIFGLRPVSSPRVTQGTPIVLATSALLAYVRANVEVYTTDSDISDDGTTVTSDFRRNILTTLAEARALTTVQRPPLVQPVSAAVTPLAAESTGRRK